jgi:hypothetical protein
LQLFFLKLSLHQLQFSIELTSWPFCTSGETGDKACDEDNDGAFIDFTIDVKGLGSNTTSDDETLLSLGDNANIALSQQAEVDGSWTDLEDGYPTVSRSGSTVSITFRLPKFDTSVLYDPVIA